jgi:hypothetical protein
MRVYIVGKVQSMEAVDADEQHVLDFVTVAVVVVSAQRSRDGGARQP